jgi:hypothetical protein
VELIDIVPSAPVIEVFPEPTNVTAPVLVSVPNILVLPTLISRQVLLNALNGIWYHFGSAEPSIDANIQELLFNEPSSLAN